MKHIVSLLEMGVEVHAIAPPDGTEHKLAEIGVKFHPWFIERRSMNPTKELVSIRRLQKIYREIKPDIVHHYTVKAVLYGTVAARCAGSKESSTALPVFPILLFHRKKAS